MPKATYIDSENQEHVLEVKEGELLYDQCEDQGIELPHGCLSGSCGACRIEVIEGYNNLSKLGTIETNTVDDVKKNLSDTKGPQAVMGKAIRLSCRAKVNGDVKFKPL
ncbi:MAG: 2Fe-2S iron-sulfur cluster-binding protein [Bacteriovoracaceae bacterium]